MTRGYVGCWTGHHYDGARPIGFHPVAHRGARADLLDAAYDVLHALSQDDLLPIGPRAVGYRLLGRTIAGRIVVKEPAAYRPDQRSALWGFKDVGQVLNDGRRSQLIPKCVSDGRADSDEPWVMSDAAQFAVVCRNLLAEAIADTHCVQKVRQEIWTEALDLMALTARIAAAEAVPVYSASGWGGPNPAHTAARRWIKDGRDVVLLYIGDNDPDGISLAERNIADATEFARQLGFKDTILPARVALTDDQVLSLGLGHDGPKVSHRNGVRVQFAQQAEAIPPDVFRTLVLDTIRARATPYRTKKARKAWKDAVREINANLDRWGTTSA